MVTVRPAVACLVAVAALGGACQGLVGIEDSPPLAPDAGSGGDASLGGAAGTGAVAGAAGSGATGAAGGTAGASGAAGSGGAADAGCNSAQPPTATPGADPGGDKEIVVAVRQLDLGDRDLTDGPSWPNLGYDLDKLCTCGTDTLGSCKAPQKTVCDGVDGRDNALGKFMYQLRTVFQLTKLSSDALNAKIEAGGNTVLLRVRGYNGAPDDAVVEVAWFASDDFDVTHTAPPAWDGSDDWPVLSASLEPSTNPDGGTEYSVENPKYVDKLAFVTNGTLVASLPQGTFALTPGTSITFAAAFLTAKIKLGATGAYSLEDGVLAGITKVGDVLGVLPTMDDPILKQPICTDNLVYGGIKNMVCGYPDMTILGTPSKPCDHLSLGLFMRGDPAKFGTVSVKPAVPSPCAAGKDPSQDSCVP